MKPATLFILPTILLAALIACNNTDDPTIDEDLLGVVWRVDTLQTPEERIALAQGERMTIEFAEDMKISCYTTCRYYHGEYTISVPGVIAIHYLEGGTTLDYCGARRELLEALCVRALENISAFVVGNGHLDLYDTDSTYVLSCSIEETSM